MSKAVIIEKNGGPEELKIIDVSVGQPGPGEIRIRHKAVGLNFIDVYQRTGLYPHPMPLRLGMEASGIVEAVGEGVTHLKAGDRAAYASAPPGSYCEERVMPAKTVCKLPDAISFETGAAMMLKGLTAQYLLKSTLPQGGLHKGDFILRGSARIGHGRRAEMLVQMRCKPLKRDLAFRLAHRGDNTQGRPAKGGQAKKARAQSRALFRPQIIGRNIPEHK